MIHPPARERVKFSRANDVVTKNSLLDAHTHKKTCFDLLLFPSSPLEQFFARESPALAPSMTIASPAAASCNGSGGAGGCGNGGCGAASAAEEPSTPADSSISSKTCARCPQTSDVPTSSFGSSALCSSCLRNALKTRVAREAGDLGIKGQRVVVAWSGGENRSIFFPRRKRKTRKSTSTPSQKLKQARPPASSPTSFPQSRPRQGATLDRSPASRWQRR